MIANEGDSDSEPTVLTFYKSDDAVVDADDDVVLATLQVVAIPSGMTISTDRSEPLAQLAEGDFVAACTTTDGGTDCGGGAVTAAGAIPVVADAVRPKGWDLATALKAGSETAFTFIADGTNKMVTMEITVTNSAGDAASGVSVIYYRSINEEISPSDRAVHTHALTGNIAANGNAASSRTFSTATGTSYYGACVISGDDFNRRNDCSDAVKVIVNQGAIAACVTGQVYTAGQFCTYAHNAKTHTFRVNADASDSCVNEGGKETCADHDYSTYASFIWWPNSNVNQHGDYDLGISAHEVGSGYRINLGGACVSEKTYSQWQFCTYTYNGKVHEFSVDPPAAFWAGVTANESWQGACVSVGDNDLCTERSGADFSGYGITITAESGGDYKIVLASIAACVSGQVYTAGQVCTYSYNSKAHTFTVNAAATNSCIAEGSTSACAAADYGVHHDWKADAGQAILAPNQLGAIVYEKSGGYQINLDSACVTAKTYAQWEFCSYMNSGQKIVYAVDPPAAFFKAEALEEYIPGACVVKPTAGQSFANALAMDDDDDGGFCFGDNTPYLPGQHGSVITKESSGYKITLSTPTYPTCVSGNLYTAGQVCMWLFAGTTHTFAVNSSKIPQACVDRYEYCTPDSGNNRIAYGDANGFGAYPDSGGYRISVVSGTACVSGQSYSPWQNCNYTYNSKAYIFSVDPPSTFNTGDTWLGACVSAGSGNTDGTDTCTEDADYAANSYGATITAESGGNYKLVLQ